MIGDLSLDVVDEAELARCKSIFKIYDEDRDGKLTYAELLTCVRSCGRNPSIEEFKELCTLVDTKLVRHHFAWSPSLAKCMLLMCCCIAVLRFHRTELSTLRILCACT